MGFFYDFYTKIMKPFCSIKPWNMFQFHQFIIHRVFVSCKQKMIFICKLLSSFFYQEKVQIVSGQNLAIPVTVIWWNRNPSWKKECQMKFDRQRTPVISGKHDWSYTMGSKNIWSCIHIFIHQRHVTWFFQNTMLAYNEALL